MSQLLASPNTSALGEFGGLGIESLFGAPALRANLLIFSMAVFVLIAALHASLARLNFETVLVYLGLFAFIRNSVNAHQWKEQISAEAIRA